MIHNRPVGYAGVLVTTDEHGKVEALYRTTTAKVGERHCVWLEMPKEGIVRGEIFFAKLPANTGKVDGAQYILDTVKSLNENERKALQDLIKRGAPKEKAPRKPRAKKNKEVAEVTVEPSKKTLSDEKAAEIKAKNYDKLKKAAEAAKKKVA